MRNQSTIFLNDMDGVINSSMKEFEEKKRKNSEFTPFMFAPTLEEKQRLVYKCVMTYDLNMVKVKERKKRKS